MRGVTLAEPRYWLSYYRKSFATSKLTSSPPRLRRFIISVDSVRPRPIMFSCCDARGPERINAQVKKARVRGSVRFTFERAMLTYPIWIGRILFYCVHRSGNHSTHWCGRRLLPLRRSGKR